VPPEVWLDTKYQSCKFDVFSLGITIYKLLFNKHPYFSDIDLEEMSPEKYINSYSIMIEK